MAIWRETPPPPRRTTIAKRERLHSRAYTLRPKPYGGLRCAPSPSTGDLGRGSGCQTVAEHDRSIRDPYSIAPGPNRTCRFQLRDASPAMPRRSTGTGRRRRPRRPQLRLEGGRATAGAASRRELRLREPPFGSAVGGPYFVVLTASLCGSSGRGTVCARIS
jgi:hypothetical protein